MASKLRPASSGRWAVAEAGMASPWTWENVDPGLFEHIALAQHPAASAAAAFPLPGVFNKRRAIYGAQLLTEAVLQLEQKSFNLRGIGFH